MFPDYHTAVWQAYQAKKSNGELSPNLMHPTTARLRDECLLVFNRRYRPGDDDFALIGFFTEQQNEEAYRMVIRKCEPDRFKRLSIILNSKLAKTRDTNIELLAFLIDFEPRPGHRWEKETGHKVLKQADQTTQQSTAAGKMTNSIEGPTQKAMFKRAITAIIEPPTRKDRVKIIGIVVIFLIAMLIVFYPNIMPYRAVNLKSNCMYWAGAQYQSAPCDIIHHDTPVIKLDSVKLKEFKKITNWSILNKTAAGKVWYAKINNELELFTRRGRHPIDTNRELHPLTDYMFNKYISPGLK